MMQRAIILLSLFTFFFEINAYAQSLKDTVSNRPMNSINYTMGEGSFYSFNYERLYTVKPNMLMSGQIGVGYIENDSRLEPEEIRKFAVLPHHITANIGKRRSFLEFGLNGIIVLGDVEKNYMSGILLGYRFQPINSRKVSFRINLSCPLSFLKGFPLIGYYYDPDLEYTPLGMSLGFCF